MLTHMLGFSTFSLLSFPGMQSLTAHMEQACLQLQAKYWALMRPVRALQAGRQIDMMTHDVVLYRLALVLVAGGADRG